MKLAAAIMPTLLCAAVAEAQLQIVPEDKLQSVFAGQPQQIPAVWRNSSSQTLSANIHTRIFQASSSTAARFAEAPWKNVTVLPAQTVLESATLTFPVVRAETRFLVQWVTETNRLLGTTDVVVYPPDLLSALKPLAGEAALGVFDPMNQLKPLLKRVSIEISDLEDVGLDHFEGKVAVLGPFESKSQMREGFAKSIRALAEKGAGVVWMQPPPEDHHRIEPSFYTVREGRGTVVVAQGELLEGLAQRPQAQITLIELCRLAVNPGQLRLPGENAEP